MQAPYPDDLAVGSYYESREDSNCDFLVFTLHSNGVV